jgi:hypothetical protein
VSTKLGTVVQLLSSKRFSASQRLPASEPADSSVARFGIATLALDQCGELSPQERRNRKTPLRGKYARFSECLLV